MTTMPETTNKTMRRVLVTGAGTGIGLAIATTLAQKGFAVVLHCGRHIAQATQAAMEINAAGGQASVLQFDIRDEAKTRAALEQEIAQNGAFWGLVSYAGTAVDGPFPGLEAQDWVKVIDTNLNGFYNVVNPCVMPMIRLRQGGRIVAITSVSGLVGNRGQTSYSASKAGIAAACKSLALELAKRKITVNAVAPGLIDTGMCTEEVLAHALPMIPLGRTGTPLEVAALVAFLFSDEAAYITRQELSINGGMC